tara:strand:- start:2204 stop:2917 length:714 start_codon:yes stop_codon:yes gene_type:complete
MRAKLLTSFLIALLISPAISTQSFEESIEDFSQTLKNVFKEKPLFQKYANSAVNFTSLVERQDIKYQVNSNTPFSGNYIWYENNNVFCPNEAGSYKDGKLHGYLEGYYGCGVAYAYKMNYKKGLEQGKYQEWNEDGWLSMEGQYVDGEPDGEWTGYEYGLKSWTEYIDNGEILSYLEYTYHQNRQLATKKSFNAAEKLNGISETYHQNGQLASKIDYKDGNVVQVLEQYDINGNPLN